MNNAIRIYHRNFSMDEWTFNSNRFYIIDAIST